MPMPEQPPGQAVAATTCPACPAFASPEERDAHEKLHGIERCPNCGDVLDLSTFHAHNQSGCLLGLLADTLSGRGGKTEEQLLRLVLDCDASAVWDSFNRHVCNPFEEGGFGTG